MGPQRTHPTPMEIPREQPQQPSFGERAARNAVFVFLILAMVTLAFGLAWGIQDLRQDDDANNLPGSNADSSSNDSVGAAIIDEIVDLLKNQYVDKNILDEDSLRQAAIQGVIAALNDSHTEYLTPAELKAGALSLDSSYDGIGASVSDTTGAVRRSLASRSPATRSASRSASSSWCPEAVRIR